MKNWTHGFLLGSSYYPEQWDASMWEAEFVKMRELGHNAVRMGEFAWAFFEPSAGVFEFDWMERAIELAARYGVQTILCTPTASVPPWLFQDHPEVLGGNEKGAFRYGARKGYCTNSPRMLEAADRIVDAMGQRFGDNPHIVGWQLDNEPGFPFVCYDPRCLSAFRIWLRERYQTLGSLNDAWGAAFWSHRYTDWDQIDFPFNVGDGAWNPGQKLDYRRFFSDSFIRYLGRQGERLRPYIGDRFVCTNWPDTSWSVDLYQAAGILDVTAWDNYSRPPGLVEWQDQLHGGMHHDIARCAGPNGRFLVAEQSAQTPAHADSKGIHLQTWTDVAHGALGAIFFEWRPPLGGAEQGYISVLQLDGSFGPAYDQHKRLGAELARLGGELADAVTDADIAMLFDYENQWAQGFRVGPDGYDAEFVRWYKGLKSLGRSIDIVKPGSDLSRYRLVAAPGLRIVSEETASLLKQYVQDGGTLLLNVQSGAYDPTGKLRPLMPPGIFADIAGLVTPASVAKRSMTGNLLQGPTDQGIGVKFGVRFADGASFSPETVMEGVELRGAESIAFFTGARMEGRPAITVNRVGSGSVFYVATDSRDGGFYDALARECGGRLGIEPLCAAPPGVEAVSRRTSDWRYLFLLNHTDHRQEVSLPSPAVELLSERRVEGALVMESFDVAVLKWKA
ncbi:beta-galactosidase [Capsulimonas corticalis]|uniref:Beta-galactosidase n=1 Tax=Capsulimonas corticalis TaxID=2219043 RepID=A0A402D4K3_9BACT|nr:beta-galactosidase [Capsulimonas corticalis]BDI29301.1 beta-galactosidase [Capsulimonas corticalis]